MDEGRPSRAPLVASEAGPGVRQNGAMYRCLGRSRPPGRAALLLAALVLGSGAAALSGCGGDPRPAGAAVAAVRGAVERTAAAESFRFRMEARATGDDLGVTFAAEGALDTSRGVGVVTMRAGGSPGLRGTHGAVEMRILPAAVYLDLGGPAASAPPDGKRWIAVDTTARAAGQDPLPEITRRGPGDVLDVLRGVSDDLERVGREQVHGAATTRYRATLDPFLALDRLPAGANRERRDRVRAFGAVRIPAEVWIDDDGLVRRLVVTVRAEALGLPAAGTGELRLRYEILETGVPVEVQAPPPEETVDLFEGFTELARGLTELVRGFAERMGAAPGSRP